jgi:hypothetical protein
MRYQVITSFRVDTDQGEIELLPGQIINLAQCKASKLLAEGKITPAERVAYKVYSEILHAHLWVVYGPEDRLRAQGISEASKER